MVPITCQLDLRPLTSDEFQEVDYRVMGHAFASHNALGRLCDEGVYQRDVQARLLADGFQCVQIEEPVSVSHRDFSKIYFLDLVADDAVYEFKTASALNAEHQMQLLNYLFLLGLPRGKLLNFRPTKVQGSIHATGLTPAKRRQYRIDEDRWQNLSEPCTVVRQTMRDLLADWGAFLARELYEQALTHFCGGELQVLQRLPLHRDGISLGTQLFHVHSPGIAFQVTTVTEQISGMESQFQHLLRLTDLRAIQWINLSHEQIHFRTLRP
jgi:GxxExxY protein